MFLPGTTTAGHYQIEQACDVCHTPFGGVTQEACLACHGEELKVVNDSHPKSKFTDPRNADRVAILDARYCVTCHQEHKPDKTRAMGVTLADDYCFFCHADLGKDRPSHANLGFDTCADAGCHNFHDNSALYKDFLSKHLHEPPMLANSVVPSRKPPIPAEGTLSPLTAQDHNAPAGMRVDPAIMREWETTVHAQVRVNCRDCHQNKEASTSAPVWSDTVDEAACRRCHSNEVVGFLAGKHGMRLAQHLPPMRPELARQPMKVAAAGKELSCGSCHAAHAFDTRSAAVNACVTCHDDAHSRAYPDSPHFWLWQAELSGQGPAGSGVSCATCHLPREIHKQEGIERVSVQHNQNLNLRPNEKMIRSVCLHCHGLGFSVDALADANLVQRNFSGQPRASVASLEMVEKRLLRTP